ncbi:MAG: endonuclease VII domain-containing protein [Actinobacteria bacterium]|nr:endonuclease VII domain-containing protein [Actinomycetota bacterium]
MCLVCSAEATRYYNDVVGLDVVRQRNVASYKKNYRTSVRAYRLQKLFGITLEQYQAMFAAQGGVCAICGEPERQVRKSSSPVELAVDHDHETGVIRALLCNNCNKGLGCLMDSPELLRRAALYLEKHRRLELVT